MLVEKVYLLLKVFVDLEKGLVVIGVCTELLLKLMIQFFLLFLLVHGFLDDLYLGIHDALELVRD